jgi:Xaa-Pro aminopeptidase
MMRFCGAMEEAMSAFDIDPAAVRSRQARLLAAMKQASLELAIVNLPEHVQWLTGPYLWRNILASAALWADGSTLLVAPLKRVVGAIADEILPYEAQSHSTLRNDQRQKCSAVLVEALSKRKIPLRVGVEFSTFDMHTAAALRSNHAAIEFVDLDPTLYRLRRRKDADELALLRHAIEATGAMYRRAREIIRPGVNELDVFNELQSVAVRYQGEMLTGTGNDYAACARGGPPRDRTAAAGELYILDLGPAFRGYFADTCRTISVDGKPTDVQLRAWQRVRDVFPIVEAKAKPGASCRELFVECDRWLNGLGEGKFDHHLGHGIGLYPHEAPHLNPNWDDVFEVGDTFTAEPGLYGEPLHAGLRLENNYLVTKTGVELLSDFPLEY